MIADRPETRGGVRRRAVADAEAAEVVGVILPSFVKFFQQLVHLASVERVLISHQEGQTDLWVFVRTEVDAEVDHIWELERTYLQEADLVSLELHVVPLDRVDEGNLPVGDLLYPMPEVALAR